jgi:predicted O-methyltransferase YrrM
VIEPPDEVRDYLRSIARPEHEALAALRRRTAAIPVFGTMQVSPTLGQLLQVLIRMCGARRVLELGVFTGYSTLAMAMALPPNGTVVALDVSEAWADIGREHWQRSGYADRIDLRIGPAAGTLDSMVRAGLAGSFDFAFIDANKDAYADYLEQCLTLLRPNGAMVFDNTLFGGRVLPGVTEERIRGEEPRRPRRMQDEYVSYTEGLRHFNARIAADPRVEVVLLPLLDGVTLALKR